MIYLSSFVWSIIECYWTTIIYLHSLIPGKSINYGMLCHKIQWFGKRLYEEGILQDVDVFNYDTIQNSIDRFAVRIDRRNQYLGTRNFVGERRYASKREDSCENGRWRDEVACWTRKTQSIPKNPSQRSRLHYQTSRSLHQDRIHHGYKSIIALNYWEHLIYSRH